MCILTLRQVRVDKTNSHRICHCKLWPTLHEMIDSSLESLMRRLELTEFESVVVDLLSEISR